MAALPMYGPLLILPPAVKRWGSPRWQGLRSHLAHVWATFDFTPHFEAVEIPEAAVVTDAVTAERQKKWETPIHQGSLVDL